ncbi:MAG: adenylyltransferase/cytidyltransferase family protein [Gammaproteobacteria bacterium]
MKIAVVSGGFDPLHSGHIAYIESAAKFGDKLYVCLNSDAWLTAKKGKPFMPFQERESVLRALYFVDEVIDFDDSDGSCIKGLEKIQNLLPNSKIIFCNGGDRTKSNIPESKVKGIELVFGVGGNFKSNSSSKILNEWFSNEEKRVWGSFKTLLTNSELKVKELIINPEQGMSFQRHFHRSEVWYVSKGSCSVFLQSAEDKNPVLHKLETGDVLKVPIMTKHQIINYSSEPCHIIEVQHGTRVDENDIERFFYYPESP